MKQKKYAVTGRGHGLGTNLLFGVGASLIVSLLLSLLLTSITINGSITEDHAGKFVFAARAVSVLIGGLVSAGMEKGKYIPVIGMTALGYLLVVMGVGILFFDGGFREFGTGLISVVIGGCLACVIKLVRWSKPNRAAKYLK